MQKRKLAITTVILAVIILTAIVPVMAAAGDTIGIAVDNQVLYGRLAAGSENGVLLIPAKELAESIGGKFYYDRKSMTGRLSYGENELVFRLDNSIVKHNGKYVKAPSPMKIMSLRFMVPAMFCYSKLGTDAYQNSYKDMLMVYKPTGDKLVYNVMSGDSLWVISNVFDTTITAIKQLNRLASDSIYVGQKLLIKDIVIDKTLIDAYTSNYATLSSGPSLNVQAVGYLKPWTQVSVAGKEGSWYRVITLIGSGYIHESVMWIKQDISDNNPDSRYFDSKIPVDTSKNYVTYKSYTVQKGDTIWSISEKMGVPDYELAQANNMTLSQASLYIGQVIKVPVHHIPVKETSGPNYGEVLDWFGEAQYVFPIGAVGKLIDIETGKSFMIKRTMGANHADSETLSAQDTQIMKGIFGGYWTWNRRPFILEYNGRKFAVSLSGMPHAGVDGVAYMKNVSNRSGGYGYGPNYDRISGNGMDGHFDLYFLNGLRHKDNQIDSQHQMEVLTAGGLR